MGVFFASTFLTVSDNVVSMKKFVCQNCNKKHTLSFNVNNNPIASGGSFPAYADHKGTHKYGFICFDCKAITIGYTKMINLGFGEPIYVGVCKNVNGRYKELETMCGVSKISNLFPSNCKALWEKKLLP